MFTVRMSQKNWVWKEFASGCIASSWRFPRHADYPLQDILLVADSPLWIGCAAPKPWVSLLVTRSPWTKRGLDDPRVPPATLKPVSLFDVLVMGWYVLKTNLQKLSIHGESPPPHFKCHCQFIKFKVSIYHLHLPNMVNIKSISHALFYSFTSPICPSPSPTNHATTPVIEKPFRTAQLCGVCPTSASSRFIGFLHLLEWFWRKTFGTAMKGVQNISTTIVAWTYMHANDMKWLSGEVRHIFSKSCSCFRSNKKRVKQTMILFYSCFDFFTHRHRHLLLFPSSSSQSCAPAARKPLVKALLAAPSSISYRGPPLSLQGALQTAVLEVTRWC